MSLLQKFLDLSNVKNFSLSAELLALRKQLRTSQLVYEMAVQDRDKKIADLEKELEATKYYTNQYQQAFYRGTDYNTKLVEENASLKEQLQTAISNYDERDNHYTTLEAAHIKLGAELDKSEQEIVRLTRDTEYKTLSEQYDKLHKVNEALTAKIAKLEQSRYPIYEKLVVDKANADQALAKIMSEKNQLDREHRALKLNYDTLRSELLTKKQHLETQLSTALKDCDLYKAMATNLNEGYIRLIDKVKAVQEVVKVLEPVSMKFQTALFNLLADIDVPRT